MIPLPIFCHRGLNGVKNMVIWFILRLLSEAMTSIIILCKVMGYEIERSKKMTWMAVCGALCVIVAIVLLQMELLGGRKNVDFLIAAIIPLFVIGIRKWGIILAVTFSTGQMFRIATNGVMIILASRIGAFNAVALGEKLSIAIVPMVSVLLSLKLQKHRIDVRNSIDRGYQLLYGIIAAILFTMSNKLYAETAGSGWAWMFHSLEYIFFSFIILLVFTVFILLELFIYQKLNLEKQVLLNDGCIREQTRQYEFLNSTQRELMKFRHDSLGHLTAIRYMAESNDSRSILNYIDKLFGEFEKIKYISTGNIIGDAVLNQYYGRCQNSGVEITIVGRFAKNFKVSETELCVIITNLMSNAFNAAIKCKEKQIKVTLSHYLDSQIICVENTVAGDVTIDERKAEIVANSHDSKIISAHGFGTINVKEAVKCTGGSVRWMKSPTSYGCIVRAEVILPVSAKLSDDAN